MEGEHSEPRWLGCVLPPVFTAPGPSHPCLWVFSRALTSTTVYQCPMAAAPDWVASKKTHLFSYSSGCNESKMGLIWLKSGHHQGWVPSEDRRRIQFLVFQLQKAASRPGPMLLPPSSKSALEHLQICFCPCLSHKELGNYIGPIRITQDNLPI